MAHASVSLCSACQSIFDRDDNYMPLQSYVELMDVTRFLKFETQDCRLCKGLRAEYENHVQSISDRKDPPQLGRVSYYTDHKQSLSFVFEFGDFSLYRRTYFWIAPTEVIPQAGCWATDLPSNTSSQMSLDFLKSKRKKCLKDHNCSITREDAEIVRDSWHPPLLLHIQSLNNILQIRLVDGHSIGNAPYFTLSYCWGGKQPLQLNSTTEKSLREGRPINDFPKTFRDAISTCHSFEVHHLWIDALCIHQDVSVSDKLNQIGNMAEIYSYAQCNISASSAVDPTVGLFFERDDCEYVPFWVDNKLFSCKKEESDDSVHPRYLVFPPGSCWDDKQSFRPLTTRAWVLQERLLSPRIMHFTKYQVFWECYHDRTMELFADGQKLREYGSPPIVPDGHYHALKRSLKGPEWMKTVYSRFSWYSIQKDYTQSDLTYEGDKLPAIDGIAKRIAKATNDEFIVGIWKSNFLEDLCWIYSTERVTKASNWRSQIWRAPSWSWASLNVSTVHLTGRYDKEPIPCVAVEHIESEKPMALTLRGKVFVTELDLRYAKTVLSPKVPKRVNNEKVARSLRCWMDDPTNPYPHIAEVTCAMIFHYPPLNRDDDHLRMQGLILKKLVDTTDRYERIGILEVKEFAYDWYKQNETEKEQVIVIL